MPLEIDSDQDQDQDSREKASHSVGPMDSNELESPRIESHVHRLIPDQTWRSFVTQEEKTPPPPPTGLNAIPQGTKFPSCKGPNSETQAQVLTLTVLVQAVRMISFDPSSRILQTPF